MGGRAKHPFAGMGAEALLAHCKGLYETNGIGAMDYESLSAIPGLYMNLYRCGLSQTVLLERLGLTDEYRQHKRAHWRREVGDTVQLRWTWERIIAECKAVVAKEGFLPAGAWFQANGRGSLIQAVYNLDKTWGDVRTECEAFAGSAFVQSRNGMRWRSHPEASLSNFLHARGIAHDRGRKYPEDYGARFGFTYGYFDLMLTAKDGRSIDIEVWGDKPNGHAEAHYARKRAAKEEYNSTNPNFLGIHYADCLEEEKLADVLAPLVGRVEPFVFNGPHDREIQPTHWSNADELLAYCRKLVRTEWGEKFPNEEWLRKRGKFRNRPGPAYNTVAVYIRQWLGGIRNARRLLGRGGESTREWDSDRALAAYKASCEKWGHSPDQVRANAQRGLREVTPEQGAEAATIAHAARKYVGDVATIRKLLGLPPPRRKTARSVRSPRPQ